MKYALNLAEDGRVLSVTRAKYAPANAVLVDAFPNGNVADYRFQNGKFIHDPRPINMAEEPTQLDRIEAQVTYTAMMTDTLLEV